MQSKQSNIPQNFICPITSQVMQDPWIDTEGNSYEKQAIIDWLSQQQISPITKNSLDINSLKPNTELKNQIQLLQVIQQKPAKEERTEIKISSKNDLALISIIPQSATTRAPCDIVVVVDISGSMSSQVTLKNNNGDVENIPLQILDIVKHAIITIIQCLEPQDRFALVTFSTQASTLLELLNMTKEGKEQALNIVQSLKANGNTNLWDGLYQGLEVLRKSYEIGKNSSIFLLTDGQPNVQPPDGHLPSLKKYKDQNKQLSCSIQTFGFGYNLDSVLLNELALEGNGSYSFIPDSSLVGTVFVHALSNVLTTSTMNTFLRLEHINGAQIESVLGDHFYQSASWGVQIPIGQLNFGQKKDFVIKVKGIQVPFLIATLTYDDSITKTQVRIEQEQLENDSDVLTEYFRLETVSNINKAIQLMKQREQAQAQQIIQNLVQEITNSEVINQPFIQALIQDITGQIQEAFSKSEWFTKWGRHYLPSLLRAHQIQQCNNFKDPGVQYYGSPLFNEVRDKADDIFVKLPPPKPSNQYVSQKASVSQIRMVDFHDRYAPCFHGQCEVKMFDNCFKQVKDIKKGDKVRTPQGTATVLCCIKTKCQEGFEYLVSFGGGLLLTPYHPIRQNGQWTFPVNIQMPIKYECEAVYSFVLDREHVMIINGIECVSLGHNFKGPIIEHGYFGSQKVIEDLKKKQGWNNGLVQLSHKSIIRGGKNGMINQIV